MFSDEQIVEALDIIRNFCIETPFCECCKLSDEEGLCKIKSSNPDKWVIAKPLNKLLK